MSKELYDILLNVKLSDDVLDKIAGDEVKKVIGTFTEDSKVGIRKITYDPNVRSEIKDEVLKRMTDILSSKGFYCSIGTDFYYGDKYLTVSIDEMSNGLRGFMHNIKGNYDKLKRKIKKIRI